MNWYIAKIVYRILVDTETQTPQFDEQLRLIAAPDQKEAFEKARYIGGREESSFLNNKNEIVKWQFIAVADLVELQKIEDGIELYSKIEETTDAAGYILKARQKSEDIATRQTVEILNTWL